jgi:hypothetical protein
VRASQGEKREGHSPKRYVQESGERPRLPLSWRCKRKSHPVHLFLNLKEVVSDYENSLPPVVDIEDLTNVRGGCACPFYLSKELQPVAEVVFMPYNYIIDPFIRQTLTLDLTR